MSILEIIALVFVTFVGLEIVRRMRRKEVDTERLDALQAGQWQIGCIDGKFAVLSGTPPAVITVGHDGVRQALDEAMGVGRG